MSSKEEEGIEVVSMSRPKILRSHSDRDDSFGGWLEKPRKGYFWSDWARRILCFFSFDDSLESNARRNDRSMVCYMSKERRVKIF